MRDFVGFHFGCSDFDSQSQHDRREGRETDIRCVVEKSLEYAALCIKCTNNLDDFSAHVNHNRAWHNQSLFMD